MKLLLFNDGDLPMNVSVSVGTRPEFAVSSSFNRADVASNDFSELLITAEFTGSVPDTYLISVWLSTNVPTCGGSLLTVTVPWTIQVTDLLLVPPRAVIRVSPDDSTGVVTQFSLANFAGFAASCVFETASPVADPLRSVKLQQTSGTLAVGALFPVNVSAVYPNPRPTLSSITVNISARCQTDSGAVLGASVSQLSVEWISGAPTSQHSLAVLSSPSSFQRGTPIVINVTLRDSVQNIVSADVASIPDVISIRFTDMNGTWISGRISSIQLSNDTSSIVASVQSHNLDSGSYMFEVSVMNAVALSRWLTVSQVTCPPPLMLPYPSAVECVCAQGYYRLGDGCAKCPKGTFKRNAANTTVFGCVACPSDWFCVAGSSMPTSPCPDVGYSCLNGKLTVLPGYSVANFTEAPEFIRSATRCPLYQACPHNDGSCAVGYSGDGCSQCLAGYTPFQSHCKECYPTGLGGALLAAWVAVVIVCSSLTTTFSCEEKGVNRFRLAFVGMWGSRFVTLLRILQDVLTVCSLQLLIPTQVPSQHLTGFLSVLGSAVTPGIWPPTFCALSNTTALLLFPIAALLPIAVVSTFISALLAPIIWRKALHTRSSVVQRFWVSFRSLTWSFYPSVLWTLIKLEH
jgi:hypothetical protein